MAMCVGGLRRTWKFRWIRLAELRSLWRSLAMDPDLAIKVHGVQIEAKI